MTSDEYAAYETVIDDGLQRGRSPRAATAGPAGRPLLPERRLAPGLTYATVRKEREKGRVVAVHRTVVLGSQEAVDAVLEGVGVQPDDQHVVRGAAARDGPGPQRAEVAEDVSVQQGLGGSRGDDLLHAVPLQLLLAGADAAGTGEDGRWQQRTPAMAAGLADHVWSLKEWLTFPAVQVL